MQPGKGSPPPPATSLRIAHVFIFAYSQSTIAPQAPQTALFAFQRPNTPPRPVAHSLPLFPVVSQPSERMCAPPKKAEGRLIRTGPLRIPFNRDSPAISLAHPFAYANSLIITLARHRSKRGANAQKAPPRGNSPQRAPGRTHLGQIAQPLNCCAAQRRIGRFELPYNIR